MKTFPCAVWKEFLLRGKKELRQRLILPVIEEAESAEFEEEWSTAWGTPECLSSLLWNLVVEETRNMSPRHQTRRLEKWPEGKAVITVDTSDNNEALTPVEDEKGRKRENQTTQTGEPAECEVLGDFVGDCRARGGKNRDRANRDLCERKECRRKECSNDRQENAGHGHGREDRVDGE
ncbi:GL14727 [Drosophila persimilis]|uniref:GL14727 n=1 Tax=Drosophila persimilis TaxID=7234 RepID=B4GVV3_DROPE|nr:GL14727 [Drosophila persimilis]